MLESMSVSLQPMVRNGTRGYVLTGFKNILNISEVFILPYRKEYIKIGKNYLYSTKYPKSRIVIGSNKTGYVCWCEGDFKPELEAVEFVEVMANAGRRFAKLRRSEAYRQEALEEKKKLEEEKKKLEGKFVSDIMWLALQELEVNLIF